MTVTGIITALLVGLVVGVLGRLAVPGRQRMPFVLMLVVGIAAALLGTWLANVVGVDTEGFSFIELLFQVVLAAIAVAIIAGFTTRSRRDVTR
jgi:uncharacterized membrane protein YeaQ/YmgE (transglycosylase-associated protein family)